MNYHGVWVYNGTTWTNTEGGLAGSRVACLEYDSVHDELYAGTSGEGVWEYNGTAWTNTGGGVSSFQIDSLACDPVHNLQYTGTNAQGVWEYSVAPADVLGTGDDAAHDFATKVNCTNGQQIIAERPMYFNYKGIWKGGHDVVGFVP